MAHTLKAYYYTDPATAVTVDFYGAVADNDGIAVDSYQMGIPGIEQARNSSLYSDAPRPVYSKHGTVTDVLTVTVRGSTNTNLYTNLHLLAKLGEYARKGSQNPYVKATPYLELKPGGSAAGEVLYAPIYDCRVEMPADWGNTVDATLTVEDVTVTIERGIWQAAVSGTATSNYNSGSAVGASSGSSSTDIGGDMTALYDLTIAPTLAGTNITKLVVGYRSKAMGGANYASLGKKEAESQTNGTDTSDAVDATASGGNKVECTFGTATIATRLSGTGIPYGTHRIFARMKITGDIVAQVNSKYQDLAGTNTVYSTNDSVLVSSTTWYVYDLGVARFYQSSLGAVVDPTATGIWAIDALRASGTAGNLDIDWVYFMPTEGYFTADGTTIGYTSLSDLDKLSISNTYGVLSASVYHVNTIGGVTPVQYTASFNPLPGPFALYWLAGTGSTGTFDTPIVSLVTLILETNPRFLMPSEV